MRTIKLNEYPRSYTVIEVLPFLKGRKIDKVVLGYLHALRPESIEVIPHNGGCHLNAVVWRVRIYLNEDETIRRIEQEVQVGCYEDIQNGHNLECELRGVPYNDQNWVIMDARSVAKINIV